MLETVNSILAVAKYLTENAASLTANIVRDIIQRIESEIPNDEIEQAIIVYTEFIGFLGSSITDNDEQAPEGLIAWSKKNGEREASLSGKISYIISRYPVTRVVYTEYMTKIGIEHDLSTEEVAFLIKRINYMLDISINETILAFERLKDKMIKRAQEEMNELSAPIVPVQDRLAILPLIGSIDSNRAKYLLEKIVPKVAQLGIECLIIDFSGIVMIDTAVANHIFKIHEILRLLGIHVIATGMRPELAQTIVHGGIDFSSIKTYATVKQAIESIK